VFEKIEFLGKAEIFGQQAVGGVRASREIDQGFVVVEAGGVDRNARQGDPAPAAVGFDPGRHRAHEQGIAQGRAERGFAVDEHAQARQVELSEVDLLGAGGKRQVDAGRGCGRGPHRVGRAQDVGKPGACERHRSDGDRVHGSERAGAAAYLARAQFGAARDRAGCALLIGGAAAIETRDRARGEGTQVMRVQHVEQRFREFRIVVVEAFCDPRIEQGKRFDHALGVRVFAHFSADQQAAGDLRVALGEFAQAAPQITELAFVIGQ